MRIDGTRLSADRFVRDASAILLTHYHSDHLGGVRNGASALPVLCSDLTARLLIAMDGLPSERIIRMSPGDCREVDDGSHRLCVTAFAANHCPGSLMFLLEWADRRVFYTGDFRLDDEMRAHIPSVGRVDTLYMDATYGEPHYRFPAQQECVEQVLEILRSRGDREVLLAVYSLGKNKIIEAAYREFGLPFYTTDDKRKIYEAIGSGHLVCADRQATPFRAYARGYVERYYPMSRAYREGKGLVIVPTGWAVDSRDSADLRYVPYSEHCDYAELAEFVSLLPADRLVALHGRFVRR